MKMPFILIESCTPLTWRKFCVQCALRNFLVSLCGGISVPPLFALCDCSPHQLSLAPFKVRGESQLLADRPGLANRAYGAIADLQVAACSLDEKF